MDIRNVCRGRCQMCGDCPNFISVSGQVRCDYCDCPPTKHVKINSSGQGAPNLAQSFQARAAQPELPSPSSQTNVVTTMAPANVASEDESKVRSSRRQSRGSRSRSPVSDKSLVVFNLNFSTRAHDVERRFEVFGRIEKFELLRTLDGRSQGFGFVHFRSANVSLLFNVNVVPRL